MKVGPTAGSVRIPLRPTSKSVRSEEFIPALRHQLATSLTVTIRSVAIAGSRNHPGRLCFGNGIGQNAPHLLAFRKVLYGAARMFVGGREFVRIGELARILGVTQQTLRNWDARGKLRPYRHPINGYRMYRLAEVHGLLSDREPAQGALDLPSIDLAAEVSSYSDGPIPSDAHELPPCHWSLEVALDPKHRPQSWNAPSSTVRRDWRKYPQEAHVIDSTGERYRRLTVDEIAILQGFDPSVATLDGLTDRERIASVGDAVPPPLAKAIVEGIDTHWSWQHRTAIEICAGIGGLAEGAAAAEIDHLLLVDHSDVCGKLLRKHRHWSADRVLVADLKTLDLAQYRGRVGLLSGGPPCQPWSLSGKQLGHDDERDLLGSIHHYVGLLEPEVFLFENVPGLATEQNAPYLRTVVEHLRRPTAELRYGVMIAQFNAADFGVPQIRERLFILGFRDSSAAMVSRCFDTIETYQSHQRPDGADKRRSKWVTIGEAVAGLRDPGGWRKWIVG
jgi:site-specific DNA-cytosine methylase